MNVQINRSRFDPQGEREGRKAECPGQRNAGRVLERGFGDLEHECVLILLTGPKPIKKKKKKTSRKRQGPTPRHFRLPLGTKYSTSFIPVTRRGVGSLEPTLP